MKNFRLFDDIDNAIADRFSEFLQGIKQGESIQVEVLSYGGDLYAGIAIAEMLIEARKRAIYSTAVIYGLAASAAAIMALAADRVVMTEVGSLMLHGVYHEDLDGKIVKAGEDIDRANAACLSIIRRRCPSYALETLKSKDNWYSAQEAKALGLIDEIRPLDDFVSNESFKRAVAKFMNAAAHAARPNNGGVEMGKAKNDANERVDKEAIEQKEAKNEVNEVEVLESVDVKTLIADGFSAILDRLTAIEGLLSAKEKYERSDDSGDIMSAKIRAMYERIGAVSKPCARPVQDEKNEAKAACERAKAVFPNIAKYYSE